MQGMNAKINRNERSKMTSAGPGGPGLQGKERNETGRAVGSGEEMRTNKVGVEEAGNKEERRESVWTRQVLVA